MNFRKAITITITGLSLILNPAAVSIQSAATPSNASLTAHKTTVPQSNASLNAHKIAAVSYNTLMQSFEDAQGDPVFPPYYAGAYINAAGCLVLLITGEGQATADNFLSGEFAIGSDVFAQKSDDTKNAAFALRNAAQSSEPATILFREARFSYAYLTGLMHRLNAAYTENAFASGNPWSDVSSIALRDDLNAINIEMDGMNTQKIRRFQAQTGNFAAIVYRDSKELPSPLPQKPEGYRNAPALIDFNELRLGQEIIIRKENGITTAASVGLAAYKETKTGRYEIGFITAGHAAAVGDKIYNAKMGMFIGDCTASFNNEQGDAAFITTESDLRLTPITNDKGTFLRADDYTYPVVGGLLFKDGATTGETVDVVTSVSASCKIKGNAFITTNLTAAGSKINAFFGDSGGIAFNAAKEPIGIVTCGAGDTFYFTKIASVLKELNMRIDSRVK